LTRKVTHITVAIEKSNHAAVKKHIKQEGLGGDIGKFYAVAATEKLSRLKNQSLFSRLSSDYFAQNGWERIGGSSYGRGNFVVHYDGVYWFCNGELLTEDNYQEKLNTKTPDV